MRITGLVLTLLGGIVHANIAAKCATDWRYWALFGSMLVIYFGGYILGVNAGKRIEE